MLRFFTEKHNRIEIKGNNVFINNKNNHIGKETEINPVLELLSATPEIKVFEDDKLTRDYMIETIEWNPNLKGQFLHTSIRILPNSAVMIDGIISTNKKTFPKWTDDDYEAIRLQPFYLSDANENNLQLIGKGLFERGLHYSGTVTPFGVRNVCICDSCMKSFTIQHFHAGFSEVQYFYSSDSKETLIVPYSSFENMSRQLQEEIDISALEKIEEKLPRPSSGEGTFKYYNSFKCPHCFAPFIDFKNKAIRSKEYYGNTYVNKDSIRFHD
jgi:hypothetical protein